MTIRNGTRYAPHRFPAIRNIIHRIARFIGFISVLAINVAAQTQPYPVKISSFTGGMTMPPLGHSTADIGKVNINSGQSDSFGRVRVSDPIQLFESQLQYGPADLVWHSSTALGGAAVHLSTMVGVQMSVGTSSGAFAIRQTKEYFRYQPGKSQQIIMTAVVGSSVANVTKDWGYGDRYNGVFFRQTGAGFAFVIRSSVTGTLSETVVQQADFNHDKLDGTGPSGFNIDLSKDNIYSIDMEWLGAGEIRMSVFHDNQHIIAHKFMNSNALPHPYMATANLPVHYSIRNTSVTVGATMLQTCSSVQMEGGTPVIGIQFSTSNATTIIGVTTRRPILSIRNKTSFNGLENRARTLPRHNHINGSNNQSAFCEIVQGGTLTGASFNSMGANSHVEADYQATAITGGIVTATSYVNADGSRGTEESFVNKVPLTTGFNGDTSEILSIVCTSFGASASLSAAIDWEEFR